jgi:TPR repeat protein
MLNLFCYIIFTYILFSLSSCQVVNKAATDFGNAGISIKSDVTNLSKKINAPLDNALNKTLRNLNLIKKRSEEAKKINNKNNVSEEDLIIIVEGVLELFDLGEYKKSLMFAKEYEHTQNPDLLNIIGVSYHEGLGTKQNYNKAMIYYNKAINNGSTLAYGNKGLLFESGLGVDLNFSKAFSLYKKGHELNDEFSSLNLGLLYIEGNGVKQNKEYGLKLISLADQKGELHATLNLGHLYYEGEHLTKNYKLAMKYYKKASELKDSLGFHRIGYMYDLGNGIDKDLNLAMQFYIKATNFGSSESAYNLGLIYLDKDTKYYNLFSALEYFQKARELGDNLANIKIDVVKKQIENLEIAQNTLVQNKETVRGLIIDNKKENLINPKNFHALIISIQDYQYLDKLKTPVNDGKVIGNLLKKQYGFKVNYLNNPSRDGITKALNNLQKSLKPIDNLLIYYAGHGIEINNDGYWLPKNASKNDDTYWLSNDYLTRKIKNIKASNILVLSDSCYSGTLTRSINFNNNDKKPLSVYLNTKSRMVITSGGLSPVLDSGGAGHSIFARFLINYLSTADKNFTATDLYTSINKKVTKMSSSLGVTQVPVLASLPRSGHVGPDFVFLKK